MPDCLEQHRILIKSIEQVHAACPDVADQFVVADGQLVRDSRLDRYLAAHKQFGGSSVLGVPSGFLRSATLQTPER